MDPALHHLLQSGPPAEEVSVVLRLVDPDQLPGGVRLVAQLGEICTARVRRADIPAVHADPRIRSVKAPLAYAPELEPPQPTADADDAPLLRPGDRRRPDTPATGRGVVVGFVDWGADFVHPDLRDAAGDTRLLALWDQREDRPGSVAGPHRAPEPYGYGRLFTRDQLNAALRTPDPYSALEYHPADADPGLGAHGTHTLVIAAGNGQAGGPVGVAPEADLVFVHFGNRRSERGAPLGDSCDLLEAVAFIATLAEARGQPWVINLSLGRHAGDHSGRCLVELALDSLLALHPRGMVVQSCGNYFERRTHAMWQLRPGEPHRAVLEVPPGDRTPNELDVWYPGADELVVTLQAGEDGPACSAGPDEQATLQVDGRVAARVYHRANDPNTGDHQCSVYFSPVGGLDTWHVILTPRRVLDGRVHAWIERDGGAGNQVHFPADDAARRTTLGSICTGFRPLVVGAIDAHAPGWSIGRFSSSGPTRDGRLKPDVVAPGVMELSARSAPRGGPGGGYVRMSGTSMAAPHVTGAVALLFGTLPPDTTGQDVRERLLATCRPPPADADAARLGQGRLDVDAALRGVSERAPEAAAPMEERMIPMSDGAQAARDLLPDLSEGVAGCGRAVAPSERPPALVEGSRHPAVGDVQARLNRYSARQVEAGRPPLRNAPLATDCVYGRRTREAALDFQRQVFADVAEHDGKVGPHTWAQLDLIDAPLHADTLALCTDGFGAPLAWDQVIGVDTSAVHLQATLTGGLPALHPPTLSVSLRSRPPDRLPGRATLDPAVTVALTRTGPDPADASRSVYRVSVPLPTLGDFLSVERRFPEVATIVRDGGTSDAEFRRGLNSGAATWAPRGVARQPTRVGVSTGSVADERADAHVLMRSAGAEVLVADLVPLPGSVPPPPARALISSPADVVYYSGHGLGASNCLAIESGPHHYDCWLRPADLIGVWRAPMDLDLLVLAGCSVLGVDVAARPPTGPGLAWLPLLSGRGGPLVALLGYRASAPLDRPVGDRIAHAFGARLAAGLPTGDALARAWLTVNGDHNANNACALTARGFWWLEGTLLGGYDIHGPHAL